MAITDPQAIRYANEQVRPLAESVRDLKVRIDAALVTWFGGLNGLIPNQANQSLEDGRDAEGVSRLNGVAINSFMSVLQALQTELDGVGVADVVSKPTVRPLRPGSGD